jgi:hypothetical protein
MGSWYILPARPEDKALLESTPSAAVGKQTDGQGRGSALGFPAHPDLLKAINSGGRGQSPREILQRRLVAQAAGGPLLVVMVTPGFDLFLSILQAQKPVFIQALLPRAQRMVGGALMHDATKDSFTGQLFPAGGLGVGFVSKDRRFSPQHHPLQQQRFRVGCLGQLNPPY